MEIEINKDISYLIGLFQTDGNIYDSTRNRGKAVIELSIKDEDIINKIKEIIPYNYTISKRKRNISIREYDYKEKEYVSIRICDQNFRKFLNYCGVPSGKKSSIIIPPLHLKNLSIKDYVRGLYDGDGSLGMTKTNIPYISIVTASENLANFLFEYIGEITGKPKKKINPNIRDNIYNIVITKEDAIKFCNEIYYEGCLCMDRKKEKSDIIKNWIRPYDMKKIDFDKRKWSETEDNYILNHSIEDSMENLHRTKKSIKIRLIRIRNNFLY